MAVNRYYRGTPYQGSLYVPPVQFVAQALESAQKQYDVNYAQAQGLKDQYIQALPQDRARANELQNEMSSKIDNLVGTYNGDYSQIGKGLIDLQRQLKKAFSPGGEAAAIQNNYNMVQASLARERERLAKGEIDANQLHLLQNYYNQTGRTTYDPDTQSYSQVPVVDLPKSYDIHKEFEEYMKGVKPKVVERSYPTGRKTLDGYLEFKTTKQAVIDPNETANGFAAKLRNDLQYQNYIGVMGSLAGLDPQTITNNVIQEYATNVIPTRTGVFEDSQNLSYKEDWVAKENLNYAHQQALEALRDKYVKGRMLFKQSLDQQSQTGELVPATINVAKSLDKQWAPLPTELRSGDPGEYPFEWMGNLLGSKKPLSYNDLMTTNRLDVNKPLLSSIKKQNPNMADSDLIRVYNQRVKDIQSYSQLSYYPFQTTVAQQEEANRLLPGLLNGSYQVFELDSSGNVVELTNQDDKVALAKSMRDKDNPLKSKVGALGKALGYTGHVPSGSSVIPDPSGSGKLYFVANPKTNMQAMNKLLDTAFGYMKDGTNQSQYFELPDEATGQKVGLVARTDYYNGIPIRGFYPARLKEDGSLEVKLNDPYTVKGRMAEPYDLEKKLMMEEIKASFPKKTESNYNLEVNQ